MPALSISLHDKIIVEARDAITDHVKAIVQKAMEDALCILSKIHPICWPPQRSFRGNANFHNENIKTRFDDFGPR